MNTVFVITPGDIAAVIFFGLILVLGAVVAVANWWGERKKKTRGGYFETLLPSSVKAIPYPQHPADDFLAISIDGKSFVRCFDSVPPEGYRFPSRYDSKNYDHRGKLLDKYWDLPRYYNGKPIDKFGCYMRSIAE